MSKAGGFAGAWRHRRWRWMLASFTVSLTGDFLYMVALVVFVLEATDSAAWVAGAAVARVMAYVVLGPVGGVIADRMNRRRLMLTLDLIRFGIMAMLAVLVWADGSPAIVVLGTVAAAAASTPYRPAAVAATPVLVPEDDLAAANAAESIVGSVAFFVGPALGAAVVTIANPGAAFAVNAATYLVSAAFITRIGDAGGRPPATAPPPADTKGQTNDSGDDGQAESATVTQGSPPGGIVGAMWIDVREGADVMRNNAAVAALTILAGAVVFQYGAEAVLLPFVATDRLGLGLAGVGLLLAAQGIGGIVAAPFMARLGARRNGGQLLAGSGVVAGATMAAPRDDHIDLDRHHPLRRRGSLDDRVRGDPHHDAAAGMPRRRACPRVRPPGLGDGGNTAHRLGPGTAGPGVVRSRRRARVLRHRRQRHRSGHLAHAIAGVDSE